MMQQTPNYKLNKPEMGDTFSTVPLNENMDTVDGVLSALDSRVVALEAHKLALGGFRGNGTTQTIEIGFTPIFIMVYSFNSGSDVTFATPDRSASGTRDFKHYECLKVVDGGFFTEYASGMNMNAKDYNYLALG